MNLIEAKNLSKTYGENQVLTDVDFSLSSGEALALIGENGAGKSTLAKILVGSTQPSSGLMMINGKKVVFASPRDALNEGLAFIPQELAYVPDLSVAENILLGQWPSKMGFISEELILEKAKTLINSYNIELKLNQSMHRLKLADRQLVEIMKALAREARIIVLDEPTAALNESESTMLYEILAGLTKRGVGIVYISHRMDEVFRFSDRVDVLRNGQKVISIRTRETTREKLISFMLGRDPEKFSKNTDAVLNNELSLELNNWEHRQNPKLKDFSLTVKSGEIVTIYGVRGSGSEVIAEGLSGLNKNITGKIKVAGAELSPFRSPRDAQKAGISIVPAERKKNGLILILSVTSNITLMIARVISKFGILSLAREKKFASELKKSFDVRCKSLDQMVQRLSGGNQQKVMLASRLATKPSYLVLHEPTRGVDIGARYQIHKFLYDVARSGCAILVVTSDVEEAVAISDKLIVLKDGMKVQALSGEQITQEAAVMLAT